MREHDRIYIKDFERHGIKIGETRMGIVPPTDLNEIGKRSQKRTYNRMGQCQRKERDPLKKIGWERKQAITTTKLLSLFFFLPL